MHGLTTIAKLNQAAAQNAQRVSKTKHIDIVGDFHVFEPDGYTVIYHRAATLPEDHNGDLYIEFAGDTTLEPRFNVKQGVKPKQMQRTLDFVVGVGDALGIPEGEIAGRLGKLFSNVNK